MSAVTSTLVPKLHPGPLSGEVFMVCSFAVGMTGWVIVGLVVFGFVADVED